MCLRSIEFIFQNCKHIFSSSNLNHICNDLIDVYFNDALLLQDIADSAYKFRKGQPQLFVSFSVVIADTLFSLLVQTLFLIQSMLVNLLPFNYFGIICNVHLCLLYSLYSFEYKWCNMGWELHKRLTYIENHWPYFLGFGTILTILTQLTSSITIRLLKLKSGFLFANEFIQRKKTRL